MDVGVCGAGHSGRASGNAKGRDQHQNERLHCTSPLVVRIGAGDWWPRQRRLTSLCRWRDLSGQPLGAASPDYKIGFKYFGMCWLPLRTWRGCGGIAKRCCCASCGRGSERCGGTQPLGFIDGQTGVDQVVAPAGPPAPPVGDWWRTGGRCAGPRHRRTQLLASNQMAGEPHAVDQSATADARRFANKPVQQNGHRSNPPRAGGRE
jgi:hypothetical protein